MQPRAASGSLLHVSRLYPKVTYQPDDSHLRSVAEAQLYDTPYRSPQPPLWELGDGEWLSVIRMPGYAPRARRDTCAVQTPLLA